MDNPSLGISDDAYSTSTGIPDNTNSTSVVPTISDTVLVTSSDIFCILHSSSIVSTDNDSCLALDAQVATLNFETVKPVCDNDDGNTIPLGLETESVCVSESVPGCTGNPDSFGGFATPVDGLPNEVLACSSTDVLGLDVKEVEEQTTSTSARTLVLEEEDVSASLQSCESSSSLDENCITESRFERRNPVASISGEVTVSAIPPETISGDIESVNQEFPDNRSLNHSSTSRNTTQEREVTSELGSINLVPSDHGKSVSEVSEQSSSHAIGHSKMTHEPTELGSIKVVPSDQGNSVSEVPELSCSNAIGPMSENVTVASQGLHLKGTTAPSDQDSKVPKVREFVLDCDSAPDSDSEAIDALELDFESPVVLEDIVVKSTDISSADVSAAGHENIMSLGPNLGIARAGMKDRVQNQRAVEVVSQPLGVDAAVAQDQERTTYATQDQCIINAVTSAEGNRTLDALEESCIDTMTPSAQEVGELETSERDSLEACELAHKNARFAVPLQEITTLLLPEDYTSIKQPERCSIGNVTPVEEIVTFKEQEQDFDNSVVPSDREVITDEGLKRDSIDILKVDQPIGMFEESKLVSVDASGPELSSGAPKCDSIEFVVTDQVVLGLSSLTSPVSSAGNQVRISSIQYNGSNI